MPTFLDRLSARQITAIVVAALFAPTTLGAVTAFTNVAVQDPATGVRAKVDASGRLQTYDPVVGRVAPYAQDPANYVAAYFNLNRSTGGSQTFYTVPAGKAFVLTNIQTSFYSNTAGQTGQSDIMTSSSVNGAVLVATVLTDLKDSTTNTALGHGIVVPSRAIISVTIFSSSASAQVFGSVNGYLVPAALVPPAAQATGTPQKAGLQAAR